MNHSALPVSTLEPPSFKLHFEYDGQGGNLYGTFENFTKDICDVRPVYSLDGETYQYFTDKLGEPQDGWVISGLANDSEESWIKL